MSGGPDCGNGQGVCCSECGRQVGPTVVMDKVCVVGSVYVRWARLW